MQKIDKLNLYKSGYHNSSIFTTKIISMFQYNFQFFKSSCLRTTVQKNQISRHINYSKTHDKIIQKSQEMHNFLTKSNERRTSLNSDTLDDYVFFVNRVNQLVNGQKYAATVFKNLEEIKKITNNHSFHEFLKHETEFHPHGVLDSKEIETLKAIQEIVNKLLDKFE